MARNRGTAPDSLAFIARLYGRKGHQIAVLERAILSLTVATDGMIGIWVETFSRGGQG